MVGDPFLSTSYIYMNAFILSFGFWAIVCPESVDAILMVCIGAVVKLHILILLLFGRSRMIVGHHRLTDELFPAAAIFCSPYAL